MRRTAAAVLGLGLALVAAAEARGHDTGEGPVLVSLRQERAWVVAPVPVRALGLADDDGDGRLSVTEVRAHREAILARVHERLQLVDENGVVASAYFEDVLLPGALAPAETGEVARVILRLRWDHAPGAVHLYFALFGATGHAEVVATDDGARTQAVLSPGSPSAQLRGR